MLSRFSFKGHERALPGLLAGPLLRKLSAIMLLAVLALTIWWPIWFMISGSVMSMEEITLTIGPAVAGYSGYSVWPIVPSWPTLQPLTNLLLDTPHFFTMFWNTFRIVVPSVVGQLVIGAPAAWALSRFKFPGRRVVATVYITLMLMPFQVSMVPNFLVMDGLGLMGSVWSVVLPFAFSAFPVFIMMRGFDAVPHALLEAADIDGAGKFRTFLHVGLPLGVPSILAAMTLGFLDVWGAIEQPMTFLNDPASWPLSLFLPQIVAEELGLAMAASLLMLMPAALFFFFGQKYLELGIQAAGVKE